MAWLEWTGILIAGLVLFGTILFLVQRRLLYPGPHLPSLILPEVLPSSIEKIEYTHGYGLFLNTATHPHDARPVLIYVHGNAETAWLWSGAFKQIVDAGLSVLLVEYPGYAGASGYPCYASIKATVLESYDNIVTRSDIDETAVIAYGRSMGGGAVSLLAAERSLAALALECTFASLRQLVAEKRIPGFLLRDRYDNAAILAQLDIPTFIYHGTEDRLIPFHHSQQLEEAANAPTFLKGAFGHNNCPRPWSALLEFIETQTTVVIDRNPGYS